MLVNIPSFFVCVKKTIALACVSGIAVFSANLWTLKIEVFCIEYWGRIKPTYQNKYEFKTVVLKQKIGLPSR